MIKKKYCEFRDKVHIDEQMDRFRKAQEMFRRDIEITTSDKKQRYK